MNKRSIGYYSMTDMAKVLGVPYTHFYHMVRVNGTLPAPTHRIGNLIKLYYDDKDVEEFKKLLKKSS
jgi:excisionase family DNA binding protein